MRVLSFNYLCAEMIQKISYTTILLILACGFMSAQVKPRPTIKGSSDYSNRTNVSGEGKATEATASKKGSIPSVIKNWKLSDYGATLTKSDLDTALTFFHDYQPYNKISFSNTSTGVLGGAYISNDFFKRKYNSDFLFFSHLRRLLVFPFANSIFQHNNSLFAYSITVKVKTGTYGRRPGLMYFIRRT